MGSCGGEEGEAQVAGPLHPLPSVATGAGKPLEMPDAHIDGVGRLIGEVFRRVDRFCWQIDAVPCRLDVVPWHLDSVP